MEEILDPEISALWTDFCSLMKDKGENQSTIAMFSYCTPLYIENDTLIVQTSRNLVKTKILNNKEHFEAYLSEANFAPLALDIVIKEANAEKQNNLLSTQISAEEVQTQQKEPLPNIQTAQGSLHTNVQKVTFTSAHDILDSSLTFNNFVEGEENKFALAQAKNVANGDKTCNPLFIYGKSGLGKTHLLRAIQNYILENDPTRSCIYRTGKGFIDDYTSAMSQPDDIKKALKQRYQNTDVLLIDDIQEMVRASGTIEFFFDTFNYLKDAGKQIVLVSDKKPAEIGMDERVISRLDSGFTTSIQAPTYELKLQLLSFFQDQFHLEKNVKGKLIFPGYLTKENIEMMARMAGNNIRILKSFCQAAIIISSSHKDKTQGLSEDEIKKLVKEKWPSQQQNVSLTTIQSVIEEEYGISHKDLVGDKRHKTIAQARHIAIWLTREMTDLTLQEIGEKFGNRKHPTIKHSIDYIEEERKNSHSLYDELEHLKEHIVELS